MNVETFPIVVGAFVALIGLGLILDGALPDRPWSWRERRRRQRADRDRAGETLVGLGMLALAVALVGRDRWNYGTVAILIGAVLVVLGIWRNWPFLREVIVFRGAARRGEKRHVPRPVEREQPMLAAPRADAPAPTEGESAGMKKPEKRMRIR